MLHELKTNLHDDDIVQKILRDPDGRYHLQSLEDVFRRNYWRNIWVVQEVLSAKAISVHCGPDSISWPDLQEVQESLAIDYALTLKEVASSLEDIMFFDGPRLLRYPITYSESRLPGLYEMLLEHKNKEATNPKDRIYALLGLTTARDDQRISVDYAQNVEQIYTAAVYYIVTTTGKLDIICAARHELPLSVEQTLMRELNLPSWVPNWTLCSSSRTTKRDFAAAGVGG